MEVMPSLDNNDQGFNFLIYYLTRYKSKQMIDKKGRGQSQVAGSSLFITLYLRRRKPTSLALDYNLFV